jgi:hypothetical protein
VQGGFGDGFVVAAGVDVSSVEAQAVDVGCVSGGYLGAA